MSTPLKTGITLLQLGYWPVPIRPGEKRPIGRAWGAERWTEDRLGETFERFPRAGVGICLGPQRAPGGGWLIDVESDGPQAPMSFLKFMGGEEVDTTAWTSARGEHNLFTADGERLLKLLAAAGAREGTGMQSGVWKLAQLPGLELRIGGFKPDGTVKQLQSVCPPTVGTDGEPRKWIRQPRRGDR